MKSQMLVRVAAMLMLFAGITFSSRAQSGAQRPRLATDPQAQSQQSGKEATGKPEAQPQGADEGGTIKVDTALVTIPVSVLDRNGRYVPQLSKRDFHIYEDNIEQEIADFGSVEVPFHVVLLLDTSRSTLFKIEDIQRAAVAFIDELRPDDRVMVVSFDDKVYIDSEFTSDRARLRRAIYGTRTGGSTKLYDAVDLVITERLNRVQGRKAIVLFTDGVDTTSRLASARSTLDRVEESGALVYPVQYDTEERRVDPYIFGRRRGGGQPPITSPWPFPRFPRGRGRRWPFEPLVTYQFPRGGSHDEYERASRYLRDLADRSGARLYQAETIHNVSQAFSQIAEELRHQYALSYYPTNATRDGAYRRIRVRVDQPDLVVRAREGYRAASGEQAHGGSSKDESDRPALKRGKQWADGQ